MRAWYSERRLLAAAAALAMASALVLWTVRRAVFHSDAAVPARAGVAAATPVVPEATRIPAVLVDETVNHDLFHPERRKPRTPFRLPGEPDPAHAPLPAPVAPQAALHLLGTVMELGKDAFVVCQIGNEPPKVVRVGRTLGSYTLRKIEPGRAVFTSPDGETVDLRVSKAGS
jgi:hypothetical protein